MRHARAAMTALDGMDFHTQIAVGEVDKDGTASVYLLEKVLRGGETLWRNLTVPQFIASSEVATRFDDMVICRFGEPGPPGIPWASTQPETHDSDPYAGMCEGHACCPAKVHEHGCFNDHGDCNEPESHVPGTSGENDDD